MKRKLLLSVCGDDVEACKEKIADVQKEKIEEIALFVYYLSEKNRKEIYELLEDFQIKEIPLAHIGSGTTKDEIDFLFKNYGTKYFTIHESDFKSLKEWRGFHENLFLEMNTDNFVDSSVVVEKIGGFCVDLAHYQKQKDKKTADYDYIYQKREKDFLFKCNHLSGYSFEKMEDLHCVENLKDFDYLKNLPDFLFGNIIAIEVTNSIKEQIEFKKNIEILLREKGLM